MLFFGMCVHVHVHVCMCACVHMCMCPSPLRNALLWDVRARACVHMCMCAYVHVSLSSAECSSLACAHMHSRLARACTHTHTRTCTHTHMHAHAHARTHTHAHAQTHACGHRCGIYETQGPMMGWWLWPRSDGLVKPGATTWQLGDLGADSRGLVTNACVRTIGLGSGLG